MTDKTIPAVSAKNAHTDERNQIIGILIDGTIYSGKEAIQTFKYYRKYEKFISKAEVRFMVKCDMGKNWERLLEMPVIFYFNEKGEPKWPWE